MLSFVFIKFYFWSSKLKHLLKKCYNNNLCSNYTREIIFLKIGDCMAGTIVSHFQKLSAILTNPDNKRAKIATETGCWKENSS